MMKRFILIALSCVLFAYQAESKNFYMISVGIADYPGTEDDLYLPAEDAKAVAALYETCEMAQTVLLLDSLATTSRIIAEAESLFSKAGEDDVIIFFFSGHGTTGSFFAYDGNLTYDDIRKVFASSKASGKIIFADACRSGAMRQGGHTGRRNAGSDVMLFFSSRDNEYSIERKSMKNGFFTTCLLKSLKGGADKNKDGTVTAKELFLGVREGVVKLSKDKQHPVMWGNFSDDMPVISWK